MQDGHDSIAPYDANPGWSDDESEAVVGLAPVDGQDDSGDQGHCIGNAPVPAVFEALEPKSKAPVYGQDEVKVSQFVGGAHFTVFDLTDQSK